MSALMSSLMGHDLISSSLGNQYDPKGCVVQLRAFNAAIDTQYGVEFTFYGANRAEKIEDYQRRRNAAEVKLWGYIAGSGWNTADMRPLVPANPLPDWLVLADSGDSV